MLIEKAFNMESRRTYQTSLYTI